MAEEKNGRSRIYRVQRNGSNDALLVRAATANQALAHVARSSFAVSVATQDECIELAGRGVKPIEAKKEESAEAAE